MKIYHKIAGAFALCGIIMGGSVYLSAKAISQSSRSLSELVSVNQALTSAYEDMYAEGLQAGQALRNILINPQDNKAVENLDVANKKFDALIQRAKVAASSDAAPTEDTGAVALIQSEWQDDQKQKSLVLNMVKTGNMDQAKSAIRDQETVSWRVLRADLLKQIARSRQISQAKTDSIIAYAKNTEKLSITVALVGFLVSLALMVYGLISLYTRLALVERVVSDIGDRGDLSGEIPVKGDDEATAILARIKTVRDKMSSMVTSVNEQADTLTESSGLAPKEARSTGIRLRSAIGAFRVE